jgi:hypothetical protein
MKCVFVFLKNTLYPPSGIRIILSIGVLLLGGVVNSLFDG